MATEYQPLTLPGVEDVVNEQGPQEDGPTAVDWATREVFRVHPVAAMFPMLAPDELADLADDIRATGLKQAVVLDADRQLIDGRNRLAACATAEAEPFYTTLPPGMDPVAYILSLNVQRRHMSQGQRAMAVAMARQFTRNGKSAWGAESEAARITGVSQQRISDALLILQWAPDQADGVLAGGIRLQHAVDIARERQRDAAFTEAQIARLQTVAPDLAALVAEDRLTLDDAIAALDRREQDAIAAEAEQARRLRERRQAAMELVSRAVAGIAPKGVPVADWAAEVGELLDPEIIPSSIDLSPKRLRQVAAGLDALASVLEDASDA